MNASDKTGKVAPIRCITVRLDLTQLDERKYDLSEIRGILVVHDNRGEGSEWTERVAYGIVSVEREGGGA